ncbi:MAG: hypothetical protein LBT29_06310 [Flavobacteriaceae bacterium]|jgi:nucleoid DNA-binding protein|nr:hypothetical protein [Flavobacteriaceae bacterium]
MNLTEHIIGFLEKYHRVTIPSFGKFELEFQPAFFQYENRQVTPPKYHLVFSQQHNLNDMALFEGIAGKESKSLEETASQIQQEISQWKQTLKQVKNLNLNRLGAFSSEREKISFQVADDCFCHDYHFGLPVINLTALS